MFSSGMRYEMMKKCIKEKRQNGKIEITVHKFIAQSMRTHNPINSNNFKLKWTIILNFYHQFFFFFLFSTFLSFSHIIIIQYSFIPLEWLWENDIQRVYIHLLDINGSRCRKKREKITHI